MKLHAVLGGLLACACGGGSAKVFAPPTSPDPAATSTSLPAPPSDPNFAARRAYQNPGGMWMPQQMTLPGHAAAFGKLGVKIDPSKLADPLSAPLGAIVRLNGCSASFVSPDGLIVTNHHCVTGALQFNSKPDQNLITDGYLSKTRADEKSAAR